MTCQRRAASGIVVLALGAMVLVSCNTDATMSVTIVNPCDQPIEVVVYGGFEEYPDQPGAVYPPNEVTIEERGEWGLTTIAGATEVIRVDAIGFREKITSVDGVNKDVTVTIPATACDW